MKSIEPVAVIRTEYPCKFGIPRQSGLADIPARVVFEKKYRSFEAIRGIEGFSRIWLVWDFTEARTENFSPTVRPPKLGGNARMGVFATRSPYRPNGLGLSCVRLLGVDRDCADAPVLIVSGADILDGTPVYDVKPYLPYADAFPDACAGFTEEVSGGCEVDFECSVPDGLREKLTEVLSLDPRPGYRTEDSGRNYAFEFAGHRITFTGEPEKLTVTSAEPLESPPATKDSL